MNAGLHTRDASMASTPGVDGMLLVSPAQMVARVRAIAQVKSELMKEGVHFYTLGGNKTVKHADGSSEEVPQFSLGKPGAEMLQLAFGFSSEIQSTVIKDDPNARFSITVAEWKERPGGRKEKEFREQPMTGAFEVSSLCSVYSNDGRLLARASGSCNNGESAFRSTPYSDAKNPVLKRAEKRAFVAAILIAAGASDMFTQDLEDMDLPVPHGGGGPASSGQGKGSSVSSGWMNEGQKKLIYAKLKKLDFSDEDIDLIRNHLNTGFPTWREGKPVFAKIADSDDGARAVAAEWLPKLKAEKAAAAGAKAPEAGSQGA